MKTLIVHRNGEIIFTIAGTNIDGEYKCLVTDIEENKEIVSVDVENNTVITKDKDTRTEDIKNYLDNADNTTISKVEDTILKVEANKIENGGIQNE